MQSNIRNNRRFQVITDTVRQLKKRQGEIATEIGKLEAEAEKLAQAIKVLSRLSGPAKDNAPRKRRRMSAAARAKIRAAQKKRWAAWHAKRGK